MPRNGIKKQFWLSEKHANKLAELSQATLLPEVTIIRFLLDGYHPKQAPGHEFHEDMNKLIDLGESFKSTARMCRDPEVKDKLLAEADAISTLRLNFLEKYCLPEKNEAFEKSKLKRAKKLAKMKARALSTETQSKNFHL